MIGKSKKLLGLTCLLLSLSLLTTKWILNQKQAEFNNIEVQLNELQLEHLTEDQRLGCALELINLDRRMSQGFNITEQTTNLQQTGIKILFPKHVPNREIIANFNPNQWKQVNLSTILKKLSAFIKGDTYKARTTIVDKISKALKKGNFSAALTLVEQIPESNLLTSCLNYKIKLKSFVGTKLIIIKAINKMTEQAI